MKTATFILLAFMVLVPSFIAGKEDTTLGVVYLTVGILFLTII